MILSPTQFAERVATGRFEFDEPLIVTGLRWIRRFRLDFAQLVYTGGTGRGPALQLGIEDESTFHQCSFRHLHLDCPNGADEGIRLGHVNRTRFEQLTVSGDCGVGLRVFQGYWNTVVHGLFNGAEIGIQGGIGEGSSANVLHIVDGQAVRARIGLHYSGTKLLVENFDCSECSEHGVFLQGAQDSELDLYTERVGATTSSEDSIVKLLRCNSVHVHGLLNCSNRASYGIDAEGCNGVYNEARCHMPRREAIHAVDCENVWDHERQLA